MILENRARQIREERLSQIALLVAGMCGGGAIAVLVTMALMTPTPSLGNWICRDPITMTIIEDKARAFDALSEKNK